MGRPQLPGRKTPDGKPTSEYRCWQAMRQRCYNPKVKIYPHYGGRGIKVCDRWLHSFDNFLKDVGYKPGPNYSLNRIDNDGDYEPGNVEWATDVEQNRNKSNNRFLNGSILAKSAEQLGTSMSTVRQRVDILGWEEEDAVKVKPRKWKHTGLTYNGETLSISEWARRTGLSRSTIINRIEYGWPVAEILRTEKWKHAKTRRLAPSRDKRR